MIQPLLNISFFEKSQYSTFFGHTFISVSHLLRLGDYLPDACDMENTNANEKKMMQYCSKNEKISCKKE